MEKDHTWHPKSTQNALVSAFLGSKIAPERQKRHFFTKQTFSAIFGHTDGDDQQVLFAAAFEERSWAKPAPTGAGSSGVQPHPRQPEGRATIAARDDGWGAPTPQAGAPPDGSDGWEIGKLGNWEIGKLGN